MKKILSLILISIILIFGIIIPANAETQHYYDGTLHIKYNGNQIEYTSYCYIHQKMEILDNRYKYNPRLTAGVQQLQNKNNLTLIVDETGTASLTENPYASWFVVIFVSSASILVTFIIIVNRCIKKLLNKRSGLYDTNRKRLHKR